MLWVALALGAVTIGPVMLLLGVVLWAIHPLLCITLFGGGLLLFIKAIP